MCIYAENLLHEVTIFSTSKSEKYVTLMNSSQNLTHIIIDQFHELFHVYSVKTAAFFQYSKF